MEYHRICKICGDEFIATNYRVNVCQKDHYLTCPICGKQYIHNSTTKRSGCSRSCSAKASMNKKRETNLIRYGVENPQQADEIKKKAEQTCLDKYGSTNPMSNKAIAKKSRESRKTSYAEVAEKTKQTCLERYGVDNPSKIPEARKKISQKLKQSHPSFKDKMIQTNIERYGVPYYCMTQECIELQGQIISSTNRKFGQLLSKYGISYKFEKRIDDKSYDLYLPNQKILIELNPTYTHSTIANHWGEIKSKTYHLEKTQLAEQNGYRCIHIFDWDDWYKIIDLISPTKSIYARDCTIYKLKPKVAQEFTKIHHLQGSCRGQIFCLGLVKDDELYQVMTFGKPRYNKNYSVELLRLCSKTGYRVVGGPSRLFKYATQNFGIDNIISYCNYSKFKGSVYEEMGMTFDKLTPPQEIWSKENEHITASLLRARGYDQLFGTHYGKGVSNEQLMLENGWLPVYDCGQKVFIYK